MEQYPKRKHPRLKCYDYTLPGYYHATIHTTENGPALSKVVPTANPVGAAVILTGLGRIAKQQLLELEQRYGHVKIDKYVIMPNHIHVIIRLTDYGYGLEPRPSLMDVLCAYKSLTTRLCNQALGTPAKKLFQTSFYETVLRTERAYQECWLYIDGNPGKWLEGVFDD